MIYSRGEFTTIPDIKDTYVWAQTRNWDSFMMGRSVESERESYAKLFDNALADHDRRVIAKAFRDMAARVRKDFADAGMMSGWVGALDDEATRIENSR